VTFHEKGFGQHEAVFDMGADTSEKFFIVDMGGAFRGDAKGGGDADIGFHEHGEAAEADGGGAFTDDDADGG
jgi:hypothetical protein